MTVEEAIAKHAPGAPIPVHPVTEEPFVEVHVDVRQDRRWVRRDEEVFGAQGDPRGRVKIVGIPRVTFKFATAGSTATARWGRDGWQWLECRR